MTVGEFVDKQYYSVEQALVFLATPVADGCRRWRCVLCGYPQGDFPVDRDDVGAYCCGGCGQSCVRPIEECGDFPYDAEMKFPGDNDGPPPDTSTDDDVTF